MRPFIHVATATAWACAVIAGSAQASTINLNPFYVNDQAIDAPTKAVQLIYAPNANMLIERNSGSAIATIDVASGQVTKTFSTTRYTDISLSPSGNYVFASDYGGENIGYGTALTQSYVTRLDLQARTAATEATPVAGNVEAISDTTFALKSSDQWVTFTLNAWSGTQQSTQLNVSNGYFSGYYASVYYGDFVYDARTQRLIHGNSGLSSQELQAFSIQNNNFVKQEGSGMYGSASGYGGTVALATDGQTLYYGRLQVDALNVSHNLLVFPELIYAANSKYAFGNGAYYDAQTGVLLGKLGFDTTVYALDPNSDSFWAYDGSSNQFLHFSSAVPEASTSSLMVLGLFGLVWAHRRRQR